MKAPGFDYTLARSVPEVRDLLAASQRDGLTAKILAGGQSLVPLMNFRLARPERIVDINRLGDLRYHEVADGHLRIGALCRHADVERDRALMAAVPAFADAVPLIGHVAVRARGTVAGSVAHGDPLAEWLALALLLDGTVHLSAQSGSRAVPAGEWLGGYLQTAAGDDEMVEAVTLRLPGGGEGSAFVELARRHGDFCLVSAAASVTLDRGGRIAQARLVLAGAGPLPRRVPDAEVRLAGEPATPEAVERALGELGAATGDLHASAAYRAHVGRVVAVRALLRAAARAGREAA